MKGRQANLRRAVFAGFTSGYVMALAGYWLEAVFGFTQLDFARAGLRYVSGGREGWWIVGIIFHLIDAVLLGILYAAVVYRHLAWLPRTLGHAKGNVASGLAFASVVWLVLAMLIAMPFLGAGLFGRRTGSARPAIGVYLLHIVYGSLLGSIYGGSKR